MLVGLGTHFRSTITLLIGLNFLFENEIKFKWKAIKYHCQAYKDTDSQRYYVFDAKTLSY